MVYPVTVTDGVLRLLGSLEVGRVCDLEAAREELGYEPRWKARDYLLAFDLYDYDDERDAGTYYAEAGSLGGKFALTPTQARATPRANQREGLRGPAAPKERALDL